MKCQFCQDENGLNSTFTKYAEFSIGMYDSEIFISDDYGHEDAWEINYCPVCGRKIK